MAQQLVAKEEKPFLLSLCCVTLGQYLSLSGSPSLSVSLEFGESRRLILDGCVFFCLVLFKEAPGASKTQRF